MVTIIQRGSTQGDLYNFELSSALQPGLRVHDPDFPLRRDPAFYSILRRDPIASLIIMLRRLLVAGEEFSIVSGSRNPTSQDEDAAMIDWELIGEIEGFEQVRFNLAWGIITGHALGIMEGEFRDLALGDGVMRRWWVPTGIKDIDKRRYDAFLVENEDGSFRYEHRLWSWARRRWEEIQHPEWFISFRYDSTEATLDRGRGIGEDFYFFAWAKRELWQSLLRRAEKLAEGTRVHHINGLRDGSTGKTNIEVLNTAKNNLKKTMSKHDIFVDVEDSIEVLSVTGRGGEEILNAINLADNGLARAGLGAVLPTGGDLGTGSFGRAKTEEGTTRTIINFDRKCLSTSLRHLNRMVRFYNRANYAELGLSSARTSKIELSSEDIDDPKTFTEIAAILNGMGVELLDSELREKSGGWSEITDQDRKNGNVIEGAEAPVPGAGGFGGGGLFKRLESVAKKEGFTEQDLVKIFERGRVLMANGT